MGYADIKPFVSNGVEKSYREVGLRVPNISPEQALEISRRAGQELENLQRQKIFAMNILKKFGSVSAAAAAGWDIGRMLGGTPLLTDPNTTYDQFYQQQFQRGM